MQWEAVEEVSASKCYGSGHFRKVFYFLAAVWSMDQREARVPNGGTRKKVVTVVWRRYGGAGTRCWQGGSEK